MIFQQLSLVIFLFPYAVLQVGAVSVWSSILPRPASLSRFQSQSMTVTDAACRLPTINGIVNGTLVDGGCRYTIKYGIADRWADPREVTSFNDSFTTTLPPSCPQIPGSSVVADTQSEDCLYAVIYTPPKLNPNSKLPVFVWIHGGSFMSGSVSAPGLVGSRLAMKGNMIVIALQYRLGVLGYLPPTMIEGSTSLDPNSGVKDVILALNSIKRYIVEFGGDGDKITLGGESSGAGMIRTLWSVPTARGLFRAAILQSDPMSYGLASPNITSALTKIYYSHPALANCTTLDCIKSIPYNNLIEAQMEVMQAAPVMIPGIAFAEPIRPTFGTTLIPADPFSALSNASSNLAIPPHTLPLLITTTTNEGGSALQSLFPSPVPLSSQIFAQTLNVLIGSARAAILTYSSQYALAKFKNREDGFRENFEKVVTDGIWRCPNRDIASLWSKAGGKVWVGEWTRGVNYGVNKDGYCSQSGRVCHEDDIIPTFGTATAESSEQLSLQNEVSKAWIAFIHNLDPNQVVQMTSRSDLFTKHRYPPTRDDCFPARDVQWKAWTENSSTSDVRSLGGGEVIACPKDFWGKRVQYDWQMYG